MGRRSDYCARLEYHYRVVHNVILSHQHPVTGLFPASPDNNHAWLRDNVYCIMAVWGLSMAYKKIADADEDRAKTYELEQSCVKLMRGLLTAMMLQKDKVEKFKSTQCPSDSLHAKYSSSTGQTVVGDHEWGHLQIDAVSLYLLILAQMTASGVQIIFSLDEVAFIQNLVFYIESAYCVPDYGMWERGDKTNHGLPELNASSVGMAKAALEAMNELDLFGARGGPFSVIHVLADEAQKCHAVLQSVLPKESSSKEIDSALLAIVSFPAFAVDDSNLIQLTRNAIISKLLGRYGCKRFLRDGYKTPKEDPNRLYYEPWELRMFENIECEWPLFFCYLILDSCFSGNTKQANYYTQQLENVMVKSESGILLVPELYAVPKDLVAAEYSNPGSQDRIHLGRCPFLWAQSLYILGKLLQEKFLAPGELDPLNRRLGSEKKPDVVVQVVIMAEDDLIRKNLMQYDINLQTVDEVAPIEIHPAKVLSHLFTYLGRNKKLGLSGRSSRDVGILSTSKLYSLKDRLIAFTPQKTDLTHFYIASDHELMIDIFKSELNFLKSSWQNMLGRPLVILLLKNIHLDNGKLPAAVITTIKKLKSGYINGTRVAFGNLSDFITTSNITNLSFLGSHEEGFPDRLDPKVEKYLGEYWSKNISKPPLNQMLVKAPKGDKWLKRKVSVVGAIKKTRSINVELESLGMQMDEPTSAQRTSSGDVNSAAMELMFLSSENIRGRSSSVDNLPFVKDTTLSKCRTPTENQYAAAEVEELLAMLRDTENLEEEGDILQYLMDMQGLQFNAGIGEDGKPITVRDLLKGLYRKACEQKLWGLVRHVAGMLGKRAEDLAKSVTDLVVRQKQITIGMPPSNEQTITGPLPDYELRQIMHQAYGDDQSSAMLTEELIIYLAMFIRIESQLFLEMLRLRVGLIIQVMAAELSRSLSCSGEEASEHLLNLSPFQMKNFLYHILSGKEFALTSGGIGSHSVISCKSSRRSHIDLAFSGERNDSELEERSEDRQGQWLRRRRLDGALNRVPCEFYPLVWSILEKCQGLAIEGRFLSQNLTQEMTPRELKFALAVETALNSIPQPEYRQLMVEALMVLTLVAERNALPRGCDIIAVDQLVHAANAIFLEDQVLVNGDATLCCAKNNEKNHNSGNPLCGGSAYICQRFYDSAPSGSYGTMTYIARAAAKLLSQLHPDKMDCLVS